MATTFTKLGIMNAALQSQGEMPLASEDDGSLEWGVLNSNWPTIVEGLFQDGAFHFSRVEEELASRAGDGSFGYTDAYAAPSEALLVRGAWIENTAGDRTPLTFAQGPGNIHVDAATGIWIEYIQVADPVNFSPLLADGLQKKLEAVILRAMKEEYAAAREMEMMAESKLQRARSNSSASKTPQPMFKRDGRLTTARFRRG